MWVQEAAAAPTKSSQPPIPHLWNAQARGRLRRQLLSGRVNKRSNVNWNARGERWRWLTDCPHGTSSSVVAFNLRLVLVFCRNSSAKPNTWMRNQVWIRLRNAGYGRIILFPTVTGESEMKRTEAAKLVLMRHLYLLHHFPKYYRWLLLSGLWQREPAAPPGSSLWGQAFRIQHAIWVSSEALCEDQPIWTNLGSDRSAEIPPADLPDHAPSSSRTYFRISQRPWRRQTCGQINGRQCGRWVDAPPKYLLFLWINLLNSLAFNKLKWKTAWAASYWGRERRAEDCPKCGAELCMFDVMRSGVLREADRGRRW